MRNRSLQRFGRVEIWGDSTNGQAPAKPCRIGLIVRDRGVWENVNNAPCLGSTIVFPEILKNWPMFAGYFTLILHRKAETA